jgi:predicted O-linked N-acetylglucosamine transferase (SPINDLY family)
MTLGHPSSSQSAYIDYVIGDAGTFADPALFTERIVELPAGSLFNFTMRPDAEFPELRDPTLAVPDVVKIAVPAMLCKLNARFLGVLQRIKQNSSVPLEFHFFPNMIGLQLHQTAREIRNWLPEAFVYERNQYNQYLTFLNACDISLCTFPFGGTNSNIDSMKMALPLVAMEGREPFERFDAIMLRKIGWPEWCIAHTDEEYEAAVLRLIDDHGERWDLRQKLIGTDLDRIFFSPCPNNNFARAFDHIYANHEAIQAGKERWIKL